MDTFLDSWITGCVTALITLAVTGYLPPKHPIVLRLAQRLTDLGDWQYRRRWLAREAWEHEAPVVTVQATVAAQAGGEPGDSPSHPPPANGRTPPDSP